MFCERCGKKDAEVHIRQSLQGVVSEHHLCRDCARELSPAWKPGSDFLEFSIGTFLENLCKNLGPSKTEEGAACSQLPPCQRCGLEFDECRKTGKFGCMACYESFREWVRPLFVRIHGSGTYKGPAPESGFPRGGEEELALLKEQLKKAVAGEKYEVAATLRDRIRVLEGRTTDGC